jgi:hypothetical protein
VEFAEEGYAANKAPNLIATSFFLCGEISHLLGIQIDHHESVVTEFPSCGGFVSPRGFEQAFTIFAH